MLERVAQITADLHRLRSRYELSMKQFQVACESGDKEKMKESHIATYEYLDQLRDIRQEVAELKEREIQEVLRILRGKTK